MSIEDINRRKNIILEIMSNVKYKPMKFKELAVFLNIPKGDRAELGEVLDSLVRATGMQRVA